MEQSMTLPTNTHKNSDGPLMLKKALILPCGAIIKNRLCKSPMSDSLGNGAGDATDEQIRLYEKWAQGGVGLSIIGEVQIDPSYPEKPGNLVFGEQSNLPMLCALASRGTIQGAHLWPQLGHAGALSHLPISSPKGPSALDLDGLRCSALSVKEIQQLPAMYAKAALLAKEVGFSGVFIHAGHGFLLQQFLSPLFNHRSDSYGGSTEARFKIIFAVIQAVREAVGSQFPIGIRINATDKLVGGITEVEALEVIKLLDQTSIDLIDISGGTYFPGAKASSDGNTTKGPYFLEFARTAKQHTKIPLMLTGGFKRYQQAVDAIESGAADMVSLARAMVLNPQLPSCWLAENSDDMSDGFDYRRDKEITFPSFESPPLGAITAWYTMRLVALGEDKEHEFNLELLTALRLYEERDAERCSLWRDKFSK
ncbi:MAG: 2,4-dienoyl-CoA reductase-like NADH-dependent reductase (Old Yellow Enzyme family) [Oceanospirillaceae bacterium]|jgi:2,4-dienoyl-CoA reductase-like NADH-dependent reductase (Old Yellow Enzyme family)